MLFSIILPPSILYRSVKWLSSENHFPNKKYSENGEYLYIGAMRSNLTLVLTHCSVNHFPHFTMRINLEVFEGPCSSEIP